MLSLIHVIEWRAAVTPDQVALSDHRGGELTYAGLLAEVERTAAALRGGRRRPGDVVPIIARNQAGWVTAMLGLVRLGALPAAVNWRLAPPEIGRPDRDDGPAAVVADADCAAAGQAGAGGLDDPEPPLLLGSDTSGRQTAQGESAGPAEIPATRRCRAPSTRLRGPAAVPAAAHQRHDRPAEAGPGHARHADLAAVTFMKLEVPEAVPGARHLSALPLFHVAGLANLSYCLFTGGHLHVLGGFDPAGVRRRARRAGGSS